MLLKYYDNSTPDPRLIGNLSDAIRDGELIIIPTDTAYSICCDALNQQSLERLAKIKGLNLKTSRFAMLCSDLSQVSTYAKLSNAAFKLIKNNTPGPFTFILPTGSALPRIYKGRKEVGIRIPRHPLVQTLCSHLGTPITGTSLPMRDDDQDEAFRYNPELIHEQWQHTVRYVVDGGDGFLRKSAIVECVREPFEISRPGIEELRL